MTRPELLALARAGAQARLNEIEVERQRLLSSFPSLTAVSSSSPRPRRVVSADARRAVSLAQKKRWAAWRAKQARAAAADNAPAKGRSNKKK